MFPLRSMYICRRASRRDFLITSPRLCLGAAFGAAERGDAPTQPVIDIHQHTNYSGRSNDQLVAHQKAMGVTTTVLLPAGKFYGLDAQCGGNMTVVALARKYPRSFAYFANEVADLPDARNEIRWF